MGWNEVGWDGEARRGEARLDGGKGESGVR